MSVKRGELIIGHIPRELSKRLAVSEVERHVTSEIFHDSNGFSVSYRFHGRDDYDSTPRPRAETKLLLRIHGAPIRFLASLFMLGLINAAFD